MVAFFSQIFELPEARYYPANYKEVRRRQKLLEKLKNAAKKTYYDRYIISMYIIPIRVIVPRNKGPSNYRRITINLVYG